jgi:hypothetical protein
VNGGFFADVHEALLDAQAPLPPELALGAQASERFAVHQHTCRGGLLAALRSAYPAIAVALGNEYFDALSAEFMRNSPPISPVLQEYSPLFPGFLEGFLPLSQWPWLGDVARIDWARREAYHAADARPLDARQLLAWPPFTLLVASLQLHPSLRTLDSAHPAWSLWQRQRQPLEPDPDGSWQAQSVQVWRRGGQVNQRELRAGESALLRALIHGRTVGQAMRRAQESDPAFNAATAFAALVGDGLVIAVNP